MDSEPIDPVDAASEDSSSESEDDGDAEGERVTKAKARKAVNAKKTVSGSLLKYATSVVSRPLSARLFQVLIRLPASVEQTFAEEVVKLKTRRGSRYLHESLHQGCYRQTMLSVRRSHEHSALLSDTPLKFQAPMSAMAALA